MSNGIVVFLACLIILVISLVALVGRKTTVSDVQLAQEGMIVAVEESEREIFSVNPRICG